MSVTRSLFAFLLTCLFAAPSSAAENARTWQGQWNNRKFGSSGTMKCVATAGENGKWEATFTGVFMGDPFKFSITFDSKQQGRRTAVGGTANIQGAKYEWRGLMDANTLKGEYRATNGYNGTFILKEIK